MGALFFNSHHPQFKTPTLFPNNPRLFSNNRHLLKSKLFVIFLSFQPKLEQGIIECDVLSIHINQVFLQ